MNRMYEKFIEAYKSVGEEIGLTSEAEHDAEILRANAPAAFNFPNIEQATNMIVNSQLLPAMLSIHGEVPSFYSDAISDFQNIDQLLGEEIAKDEWRKMLYWRGIYCGLLKESIHWVNTVSVLRPEMTVSRLLKVINVFAGSTGTIIKVDENSEGFAIKSVQQTIESEDGSYYKNDRAFDVPRPAAV